MNVGLRKLRNCGLNILYNHFTAETLSIENLNAALNAKNMTCTAAKG